MKVDTTRFGAIEVPEEKIIDFPEGVIGFSDFRKFVVIRHRNSETMYWLQSLDKGEIAFLMMFPFVMMPDYNPCLSQADMEKLKLASQDLKKAEVYNITVVPKDNPQDMMVNLLSPIVINPETRLGKQAVLDDSRYTVDFKIIKEIKNKLAENEENKEKNAHPQEKKE